MDQHHPDTNTKTMLHSKTLVYVLFAAWSLVCWRWYVCGIKQACEKKIEATSPIKVVETPAIEVEDTITVPQKTTSSPVNSAKNNEKSTFSASDIDKVQLEEVEDRMVIHFPYNSVRREDNDAIDTYLSNLASSLKASGKTVSITGHTDFVGDSKTNYNFGLKRANNIKEVLIKKGVPKAQIKCYSKGDTKPVATNDTPQGRYKNRRAEIRIKN
jgi:outer membrane protein OmpA-like peptidoglycan-associated protein